MAVVDLAIDDVLRLRKAHPCGSHEWRVVRLDVERRYLAHVSRGGDAAGPERAP